MNYEVIAASIKKTIIGRKIKSLIAVLLLTASSVFAQVPSYVPTNGLLGWWPFNGNANDQSGNGNNGTVTGAQLTNNRLGNVNSAYTFNGSSDFITVPASSTLNFTTNFSFSCWVNIPDYSQNTSGIAQRAVIGKQRGNNLSGMNFIAVNSSPSSVYSFGINDGPNNIVINNGSSIPLNTWSHFVGTYDGLTGKLYKDGNLVASNNTSISFVVSTQPFYFGKEFNTTGRFFKGEIDDMGMWNRALTQQEITALYNSPSCTGTGSISADGPTTFCAGNSVNLTSDVIGGTYQWRRNGVNISTNATSRTFKASSTGSYTCVATCNGTALTSNAIAVTSKTNAAATVSASGATSFCAGDSVTLNCTNLGSNYSVQWYRTNVSIENATNYSQIVKQPGTYKVVTRNLTNGCSRISGSAITTNVNCRIANYSSIPTTYEISEEDRFDASEFSNGIKIYPNPNNGSFQFKYEGEESGDAQLEVINTMGQTVYQTAVNIEDGFLLKEIMLGDNFQKGIYIVRLLINGGQNDSRVLIQ